MSDELRRLAAGVLLPGFVGTTAPPWLLDALGDGLAGVAYFGHNVTPPPGSRVTASEQVTALSAEIHGARPAALVAIDEEGGDVTRLHVATGSDLPGNAALGSVDDVGATEAVATALGLELRRHGVDVDFAPCVDVNSDPRNPVIGVRSFGSTADLVARHGAAFTRGLQAAGVAACAKHFPGHGDTLVDSHHAQPVVTADEATVRARELPPFAAAIEAGARCVLTAHVSFPSFSTSALPASLDPAVTRLLRGELGFDGVIVTDALDMRAITGTVGLAGGAVAALRAGADLLCIGNPRNDPAAGDGLTDLTAVWDAVVAAVASGELRESRLQAAAGRVRALASWVRSRSPHVNGRASLGRPGAVPGVPAPGAGVTGPASAPALGHALAARALVVQGDVRLATRPEVLDLRRHVNVAAGRNSAAMLDELTRRAPATAPAGGTVVLVDEPQRDAAVRAEITALLAARPDAVVVATGWPDASVDLGRNVVRTFGNGLANARAAADALFGENGDHRS